MKKLTKDDIIIEAPVLNRRMSKSSNLCAPVAVSLALGIQFDRAYNLLSSTGLRYGILMNSDRVINKVIEHKFNRYRKPFQLINNPGKGYATVGDVILGMYKLFGDLGYLISSAAGSTGHIQYVKGLTVYDGAIATDGTLKVPKCRETIDSWLDRDVNVLWIPKNNPEEPIYCDPKIELFTEIKLCGKFYGLFADFHIDQRVLPPSFHHYEIEGGEGDEPDKLVKVASNNRIGCFLTQSMLLDDDDELEIYPRATNWELICDEVSLDEFKYKHRKDK